MNRPDPQTLWRAAETATLAAAALLVGLVLWTLVSRGLAGGVDELDEPATEAAPAVDTSSADSGREAASDEGRRGRGEANSPRLASALQAVRERNIFEPPRPEGFQGRLTGILGDQAVFNGSQQGGVGDNVMGAKVLAIGADWVEIEFEGGTRKMHIFGDGGRDGAGDGPSRRGGPDGRFQPGGGPRAVAPGEGRGPRGGGAWRRGGGERPQMTEEMRQRFEEMRARRRAAREQEATDGQE